MKKAKQTDKIEIIKNIAINGELTITDLKIFLFLIDTEATQAQISRDTNIPLVSVKTSAKRLLERNYINETRTEGRNKFLTANLNFELINKNQIKLKLF